MDSDKQETPVPTILPSGAIKAIAKDTVHKICSGQVVVSLAVAVKELVENAIDANATLIEIKLFNQGLESIEVVDNGTGVEAHNLESMTAKYHTSKIREFADLQEIESFGFRGEALSSLCALSDMVIQTRHKSTDVGVKFNLDCEGKIKHRAPCARPVGTTVTISNLFGALPVRRRDFERNIKKEFTKTCQILQAYCLVLKGVRIICFNQSVNGSKKVILQTHGALDMLANISAVFGPRQIVDIVQLKSSFNNNKDSEGSLSTTIDPNTSKGISQLTSEDISDSYQTNFKLEGYISSCNHGTGRSARDRQFFFVNSRPCDLKNVAKVINEVYHQYNAQQYPFVCLNILTARDDVDINLTPDKRQLLLNNEKGLILKLKNDLIFTFGNTPSNLKLQNVTIASVLDSSKQPPEKSEETDIPDSLPDRFLNVLTQWKHTGDTIGRSTITTSKRKNCSEEEIIRRTSKLKKINNFFTEETLPTNTCESKSDNEQYNNYNERTSKSSIKTETTSQLVHILSKQSQDVTETDTEKTINCEKFISVEPTAKSISSNSNERSKNQISLGLFEENSSNKKSDVISAKISENEILLQSTHNSKASATVELDECEIDEKFMQSYSCSELRTTLADIALNLQTEKSLQTKMKQNLRLERLRFKSEIKPTQNQTAEAELQREILKEDFARMNIIGQFNLGFIIVKLDDDLFIVDQHATDEKYNFEILQKTTQLEYQKLTVPQTLELTAVNEMILLDNISVFEKNGFKFMIDEHGPTTKKIRLLGKPYSKNWQFGKDDIDELIFMLQDAPDGFICRPSRIRAMFASRACRKSVMIGKALNLTTMKTLITHMGEIEQPWNCPHGRPTIRHLININLIMDEID